MLGRRTLFASGCIFIAFCFASAAELPNHARLESKMPLEVSCLGAKSAKKFMIYLHGIDSINPSPQELKNREILKRIAEKENIRFALPRARLKCPNDPASVCWGWKFTPLELSETLPLILDSRSQCFKLDEAFGIIGFSNGGYFISHWYMNGMVPKYSPSPSELFASGSGKGEVSKRIKDLSKNPKFTLIIGTQDEFNFDPKESLFHELKKLQAPIQLFEFSGAHQLDEQTLLKALSHSTANKSDK
jgi:hypothetical protein